MDFINYLNNLYNSIHKPVKLNNTKLMDILQENYPTYYENFKNIYNFYNYLKINLPKTIIINEYSNEKDVDSQISSSYLENILTIKELYNYIHMDTTQQIQYLQQSILENTTTPSEICCYCKLLQKYKNSGSKLEPSNYRYMTDHTNFIKTIDRIFLLINNYIININKENYNIIIPTKIFKMVLFKNINSQFQTTNLFECCNNLACNNTESKKNVLCLDIKKAFDNVEWFLLYESMINVYNKIIKNDLSIAVVTFYFVILQNRMFTYKNNKINVHKGISQGLPSSNLIFTLFMNNIINKFILNVKLNIYNYINLYIYVDDIYIKFKSKYNYCKNNFIINNLINELNTHLLEINNNKSFGDKQLKLNIQYSQINKYNKYLGIYFTRCKRDYLNNIMYEFKNKYNIKLFTIQGNPPRWSWFIFYNIIKNKEENYNLITGYLQYKLKPFIKSSTNLNIYNFIKNLIK
jgi:hypothetical protein